MEHHYVPEVTTLISFFVTYGTSRYPKGHYAHLLQPLRLTDTSPHHRSPHSFLTQPVPREEEDFSRGSKYPKECAYAPLFASF